MFMAVKALRLSAIRPSLFRGHQWIMRETILTLVSLVRHMHSFVCLREFVTALLKRIWLSEAVYARKAATKALVRALDRCAAFA